jgi:hypothetical protein
MIIFLMVKETIFVYYITMAGDIGISEEYGAFVFRNFSPEDGDYMFLRIFHTHL